MHNKMNDVTVLNAVKLVHATSCVPIRLLNDSQQHSSMDLMKRAVSFTIASIIIAMAIDLLVSATAERCPSHY